MEIEKIDPPERSAATLRAEALVARAVDEAVRHISRGTMVLHWRVQRALVRLIAEASEPAGATGEMHAAYSARFGDCG